MRSLVLPALALLSLGACASGQQGTGGAPATTHETTVLEKSEVGAVSMLDWKPDVYTWTHAIPSRPERTWQTLPAVYAQLGLPGGVLDGKAKVFGASRARFRRLLAGKLEPRVEQVGLQANRRAPGFQRLRHLTGCMPRVAQVQVKQRLRRVCADGTLDQLLGFGGTSRLEAEHAEQMQCVRLGYSIISKGRPAATRALISISEFWKCTLSSPLPWTTSRLPLKFRT
jgi:hypothetical protein